MNTGISSPGGIGGRNSTTASPGRRWRLRRPQNTPALVAAGTAAGLALVALLPQGSEQGFFLVGIGLAGWHWLLPRVVPAAAGAVAWASAAVAARRGLRRWS